MAIHKHRKKFLTKMQADSFYSKIKYDLDMNCDMPWHDRDKWIVGLQWLSYLLMY